MPKSDRQKLVKVSPTASGSVTTAVTQHIKSGKEKDFEVWLRQVGQVAARFPGHQGLTVLAPSAAAPRTYTYLFRFDSYAHLQAWEQSAEKEAWIEKLQDILETPPEKRVLTGLEYWFQLPGSAVTVPPKRYKMATLTVIAIYPLSQIVPRVLRSLPDFMPSLLRSLCYSVTLVVLMTYVVMPTVTRLFARWLFKKP
jgi:antibiotic biosynthesis monooxygenase (ABM) superfamily enzyme